MIPQARDFVETRLRVFVGYAVLLAPLAISLVARAQEAAVTPPAETAPPDAIYLAGLGDIKPQTKGLLQLQPEGLEFSNHQVRGMIPTAHLIAVSIGDEKTERGGTTGKIARKVIPYGGGAALGAASQKSVDLLTLEYRDTHGGYHGAIFVLPSKRAEVLRSRLASLINVDEPKPPKTCTSAKAYTVLLEKIETPGIELPAEYRALLYENLLTELRDQRPGDTFFRAGDLSAGQGCAALSLRVSVTGFNKGNQAVRASTGPLGLFLGTTSIHFNVHLASNAGQNIFEADLKQSKRSDSDSLNVAHDLAKTVAKRMDKALKKEAKAEADKHASWS